MAKRSMSDLLRLTCSHMNGVLIELEATRNKVRALEEALSRLTSELEALQSDAGESGQPEIRKQVD